MSFGINSTPQELAEQAHVQFAAHVGFEFVSADGLVTHAEVLRRYFDVAPPFSKREAKKNEFPDALALLSLEAWAARADTKMLLVSRDQDWESFANTSDRLICVSDLATALDYFNSENRFVAERAVGLLCSGGALDLHDAIELEFELFLEALDPDIDAWSAMEYEVDIVERALQHWDVDDDDEPKVLEADANSILFSIKVNAIVNFTGHFAFSIRDSVDRDYVNMGSNTVDREATLSVALVVRIDRQFDRQPNATEVEVTPFRVTVHFGDIDPDRGDGV